MTRKHGGKTWVAPKVLIREDVSCLSSHQLPEVTLDAESSLPPQYHRQEP